jgi:hypothetical protein
MCGGRRTGRHPTRGCTGGTSACAAAPPVCVGRAGAWSTTTDGNPSAMSAWLRKTRRTLGVFGHRARPCAAPRQYAGRPACDGGRAGARLTRAVGAGPVARDEPPRAASGGRTALRCHPRPGDARVAPCRHHAPGARMCPALDLADPPRRLARSGERGRPDPPTARGASSRPADPGAGAAPASRPRERCGGAAPLSMPIRETDEGAAGG